MKTVAWQKGGVLGAIVVGLLLVVAVVVWTVGRSISGPIHELNRVMKQVAEEGNLDGQANVNQADELGQMAGSFNRLLGNPTSG